MLLCCMGATGMRAQTVKADSTLLPSDSIVAMVDSIYNAMQNDTIVQMADSAMAAASEAIALDLAAIPAHTGRDWARWRPKPQRALWLALVIPGGGQIYNRKYWKLPIVYGGFVGCIYALTWNNSMYRDYAQAYLDIMATSRYSRAERTNTAAGATSVSSSWWAYTPSPSSMPTSMPSCRTSTSLKT